KLKQDTVADLAATVGKGMLSARDVLVAVYPGAREELEKEKKPATPTTGRSRVPKTVGRAKDAHGNAVPIRGLIPGMAVHFAHCCHPLPGDRIVGIVTTGKGVTIHTIDCETLSSFQDTPERWVDIAWESEGEAQQYTGRLHVVVVNEPG